MTQPHPWRQDIPEFFEDHMADWFDPFFVLLTMELNPAIESDDTDSPTVQERIKTEICNIVGMYANKYDEEFAVRALLRHHCTFDILLSRPSCRALWRLCGSC